MHISQSESGQIIPIFTALNFLCRTPRISFVLFFSLPI